MTGTNHFDYVAIVSLFDTAGLVIEHTAAARTAVAGITNLFDIENG